MEGFKIEENGLSVEFTNIVPDNAKDYMPIMGGDNSNPTWEEYKKQYQKQYHPHLELIKKGIIENRWLGATGEDQDEYAFVFSDGAIFSYTWRAWGDLMQAIVNKKEGYMTYYM